MGYRLKPPYMETHGGVCYRHGEAHGTDIVITYHDLPMHSSDMIEYRGLPTETPTTH